jgi:anti-anti-sigma factor
MTRARLLARVWKDNRGFTLIEMIVVVIILGLLAGLAERGTDLTTADLVVGTSAGAGVAARASSGVSLAALYEKQLAPVDGEIVALGEDSWPDFERLQQRMNARKPGLAQRLAPQVPVTYLAFDLSAVTFIDSSGIRALLRAHLRAEEAGTHLRLMAGPPNVHRVFEVAGLDKRLDFVGTAEA